MSFLLLVFPGMLIDFVHKVSPQLFISNRFPCYIFFTRSFRFGKIHISDSSFVQQVSPWLCPVTRQGMHLSVALENSTLRRILSFLSSCFRVSPGYEYTRTFWRHRTFRGWRTCRNLRKQVCRCRFRLCHTSFFSFFLLLHPFRHRVGAAYQAGILSAARRSEMADVNKWKRLFHSSRVKLPLVKMSARWCLVSMYRSWILESRLILSNNQSKATLWVLDTCLIVGLLPFVIILITASLSSNTYNITLEPECVPLDGTWSILVTSRLVLVVGICFRMFDWRVADKFLRGSLTSLVLLVWWGMKYFNHWIPKIESRNPIHA